LRLIRPKLEIVSSRLAHLWDELCRAYEVLGLHRAADGDEVFRDLALARIIEPTSKADSLRVLAEAGVEPVSCRTLTRHLPNFAKSSSGGALRAALNTRNEPSPREAGSNPPCGLI
jgi:hypothetical protein